MTHKLIDIPLEQLVIEHYLFDLEYPPEKVSEILDVDENLVKKIHGKYLRESIPGRRNK